MLLTLTLLMLRLLLSKAQELKNLWKSSKPYHLGIHWKALNEYVQMSTICQGFGLFSAFFTLFCIDQISLQQHKGLYSTDSSVISGIRISWSLENSTLAISPGGDFYAINNENGNMGVFPMRVIYDPSIRQRHIVSINYGPQRQGWYRHQD